MSDHDKPASDLTSRVIGGVAGGVIGIAGAAVLGPFGVLLGSLASPVLSQTAERVLERRGARAEAAAEAAQDRAQLSFEQLVEHASDDDRRWEIIGRALQAAAMSEDAAKIRALGWALADGVLAADDAKVDESLRIVSALGQLEPADVKVLVAMSKHNQGWHVRGIDGRPQPPTIVDRVAGVEQIVDSIVARLSMLGLITEPDSAGVSWEGTAWFVTSFGRLCVETLLAAGTRSR